MDDLISRQAAIDIGKELTITLDGYEMSNQAVMNYCAEIMQLPSAQPTFDVRDTQYNLPIGTDLISRKQAIEVVQKRHMMLSKEKVLLINDLEKLPSAQLATDTNVGNKAQLYDKGTTFENGGEIKRWSEDIISRQAVMRAIDEALIGKGCSADGTTMAKLINEYVIKKVPSTEPKRGKWIEDRGQQILMKNFIERGEVWRVCSVCGAGHMIGHKYECDKAYHDTHHNFCPNCGAKMKGVSNES